MIDESGYEVCDKCKNKNPEHELLGMKNNSYQLCQDCVEKVLEMIDKFVEEGGNK